MYIIRTYKSGSMLQECGGLLVKVMDLRSKFDSQLCLSTQGLNCHRACHLELLPHWTDCLWDDSLLGRGNIKLRL